MRLRLTPLTAGAGGTRMFEVNGYEHNLATQQLTLALRDGKMALEVLGSWELECRESRLLAHTCDEAERIHNGRALVIVN